MAFPLVTQRPTLLERIPARLRLPLAVLVTAAVGLGDYFTSADIAFTLLYLAPIAFTAWFCGRLSSILLASASGATFLVTDLFTREVHFSLAVQMWNFGVELGVFLTVAMVVSTLRARLLAEAASARADPLTHVSNRRSFDEAAAAELARARRTQKPLTIAYLDLDDFKRINDRFGHQGGDDVLVAVASALRGGVRVTDLVARIGGDEFVVLFPDADAPIVLPLLARVQSSLDALLGVRGWPVSFSIGAATYATPPASVDVMLSDSDALMYEAKSAGKNRVVHRAV